MQKLNTAIFRKEDFSFESLNGTTYTISGHLSTDFYLFMMDTLNTIQVIEEQEKQAVEAYNNLPEKNKSVSEWNKLKKLQLTNQASIITRLKEFAFRLASLDKSKEVTAETIATEFDNYELLAVLFGKVMTLLSNTVNNPN